MKQTNLPTKKPGIVMMLENPTVNPISNHASSATSHKPPKYPSGKTTVSYKNDRKAYLLTNWNHFLNQIFHETLNTSKTD